MAGCQLGVDRAQLGGDDLQPLALEAAHDRADESPLDGIGLADDEGAVHREGRLAAAAGPQCPLPSCRRTLRAAPTVYSDPVTRSISSGPARARASATPSATEEATSTVRPIWAAADATSVGGRARGDGGGQATTRTMWEGSSASSISTGSRPP